MMKQFGITHKNRSDSRAIKKWSYEYLYMIVMVVYACTLTSNTCRMNFGMTWDIPFFLPMVLTLILVSRNKVNFNNNQLIVIIGVSLLWIVAITLKQNAFYLGFQSYNFFLIYGILIAYIHVKVYRNAYFDVYEDVMVLFSKISLPLWLFGIILPGAASTIFREFPIIHAITADCHHIFYLYNWFDPATMQASGGSMLYRNSGPAFEPGYYAILLCLAILNNVSKNGLKFRGNTNIIILLIALLSTFSTTGYSILLFVFAMYYLKDDAISNFFKLVLIVLPLSLLLFRLDFMGDKIEDRSNLAELNDKFYETEEYNSSHGIEDFHSSLDRFQSLYFEWENIKHDPILGYSRDLRKSWFGETFSSSYSLTGGLLKIIGQFGVIFGFFWYWLLFKSSRSFAALYGLKRKYVLALVMMLASVSYGYFGTPVFMTFWLYGVFCDRMPPLDYSKSIK